MDFLLNIEIIIWLVLSIMLVLTPLIWLFSKYMPRMKDFLTHLKDIKLPDMKQLREMGEGLVADTATPLPQDKIIHTAKLVSDKTSKGEEQNKAKDIHKHTQTKNKEINNDIEPTPKLNTKEQMKKNKKLETIKFTAIASKERGNSEQYEKKLVEGLALDPQHIDFLSMLSTYYFETNQEIKALSLLKKIVNTEPNNHKAIWQIGQIYSRQSQFDTAQLLIEKAIKLKNDHPKYYISLVEIYYEKGQLQKAIQTMEKILKLRPTNTDYLLTMATLYEEDKKPNLASKYFSKVLEVDPGNAHAKKGMKRVV